MSDLSCRESSLDVNEFRLHDCVVFRTVLAGLSGGLGFGATAFLTFGPSSGARGEGTGLPFDPTIQSPKVIAVWKTLTPLPLLIGQPPVILLAGLGFAVAYSLIEGVPLSGAGQVRRQSRLGGLLNFYKRAA
jgi:hypothetical protein